MHFFIHWVLRQSDFYSSGSTTVGLFSDLDGLYCKTDVEVIEFESEWQAHKAQVMLQFSKFNAYRTLVLMSLTCPRSETIIDNQEHFYGKDNLAIVEEQVFLRNTYLLPPVSKDNTYTIHGPAKCRKEEFGERSEDLLNAFSCRHIPDELKDWTQRVKDAEWPSQVVQEYIKTSEFFLVPVGHKQSKIPSLEYRLCTSLAEQKLVFSMNITQIRCLIIIKMLMKTHVNKVCCDAMKTYFCKTGLFYTIEKTANRGWGKENVVDRVIQCLRWLRDCFNENNMPHYFMPSLNMLEGRFNDKQRGAMVEVLEMLINDCVKYILEIGIDDVGLRLLEKRTGTCYCFGSGKMIRMAHSEIVADIGRFLLDAYYKYCRYCVTRLLQKHGGKEESLTETISILKNYLSHIDKTDESFRLSVKRFKPQFCSSLGTLQAAAEWENGRQMSYETRELLFLGKLSDAASGRLKYAATLYRFGEYKQAKLILDEVQKRFPDNMENIAAVCGCDIVKMFDFPSGFLEEWKKKLTEDIVEETTVFCVAYVYNDIDAIPSEFINVLFPLHETARNTVSIDPLPYFYGLQYLTFRQLGESKTAKNILEKLNVCIQTERLYHVAFAALIRDTCYDLERRFVLGKQEFC